MPELPEVETTRRGIAPYVQGQRVARIVVRQRQLRWPVPAALTRELRGQTIHTLSRRAKYLLFESSKGTAILHLGMSGTLRVLTRPAPLEKHDHVDLVFAGGATLRFNDPRRFGCLLWTREDSSTHPLLAELGPEPLARSFDGAALYESSRDRRVAIKNFIMNPRIVVGVGNIYASEALHRAGIHPRRPAGRVALERYLQLARDIKQVLRAAIRAGGTTLRDFTDSDGVPGYFARALRVYGREGEPCRQCGNPVRQEVIGQRASYFCPRCQR